MDNFNLVVQFYNCPPAEVEEMKDAARRDMPGAEECFAHLAAEAREAGFVPLDATGSVAVEVNRQRRGR